MNLLNHNVGSLTFQDIVSFCEEKYPEGLQLDYKRDLIDGDKLAKTVAAFANRRGGVIIFGVVEDKVSGLPVDYSGFECDAKTVGSIEQMIANVDPLPEFEIKLTNQVDGKGFIVLRIYEGSRTPYYVFNDSNVWVRTGSMKKPIDIASPDFLELLFSKKEKALKLRSLYENEAKEYLEGALGREGKLLKNLTDYVPLEVIIQPFYPNKAFVKPSDLKGEFHSIVNGKFSMLNSIETVPAGIMSFDSRNNAIQCLQLYSHGLLYYSGNLFQKSDDDINTIYVKYLTIYIIRVLKVAQKFYNFLAYQDGLVISLSLRNIFDIQIRYNHPWPDHKKPLKNRYNWDFDVETSRLSDSSDFLFNLFEKIYWALDLAPLDKNDVKAYWDQN